MLLVRVLEVMVRRAIIVGAGRSGSCCRRRCCQCRQLILVRLGCGRFLKLRGASTGKIEKYGVKAYEVLENDHAGSKLLIV